MPESGTLSAMTTRFHDDNRPRRVPLSHRRALIGRHTRLRPVEGVAGVRLHLADEAAPVWRATEMPSASADAPIPFWAFAWAGGLAIARYLQEHPERGRGQAGGRLRDGIRPVRDRGDAPGRREAVRHRHRPVRRGGGGPQRPGERRQGRLRRAGTSSTTTRPRPTCSSPATPGTRAALAERVLPYLRRAAANGTRVLVGDPGRRYLPALTWSRWPPTTSTRPPSSRIETCYRPAYSRSRAPGRVNAARAPTQAGTRPAGPGTGWSSG